MVTTLFGPVFTPPVYGYQIHWNFTLVLWPKALKHYTNNQIARGLFNCKYLYIYSRSMGLKL